MLQQAYELHNADALGPLILLAEHASGALPEAYGMLGLSADLVARERDLMRDCGVQGVVRGLKDRLGATAVLGVYSRLLIDLNRGPDHPALIPDKHHGHVIPSNQNLSEAEKTRRKELYYTPFHACVAAQAERRLAAGIAPVFLTVHSYPPLIGVAQSVDPSRSPPDIDLLSVSENPLVAALRERLVRAPVTCAENFPYDLRKVPAGGLHHHALSKGYSAAAIEISIDRLVTPQDEVFWAEMLAEVLQPYAV